MKPTPLTASFDNVYEPFEDSFFLLDCLEKDEEYINQFNCPLVCEIGCGSGVVSSFVPQVYTRKYIPLACDISSAACSCSLESWKRNYKQANQWLEAAQGYLTSFLRPNLVDILIFNPPYVPTEKLPELDINLAADDDKWVDFALDGGDDGMEITNLVLDTLPHTLSANGVAYILFCAQNKPDLVCERMLSLGIRGTLIDKRRAGREMLYVYRFERQ